MTIPLLSLAGMILAALIGTFWYSNATPMGKIHMQYLGFDKLSKEEQAKKMEEAKPMMAKLYAKQMSLSLLTSFATVFIITMSVSNGLSASMAAGFVIFNWLCFTVPAIGTAILWSNCDRKIAWKKFLSDSCYNLVTLLLIAGLTSLFVR